jgi:hypothetical protein
MSVAAGNTITIRSTLSSYIALCGIWVALALVDLVLHLQNTGRGWGAAALIATGIGLLFWLWLRGFKLSLSNGSLEYRDGLYRSLKIDIEEIASIRDQWIGWSNLGRSVRIPRIVVLMKGPGGRSTSR